MLQNIQKIKSIRDIAQRRKIHASLTTTTAHGSSTASQNLLGKKGEDLVGSQHKRGMGTWIYTQNTKPKQVFKEDRGEYLMKDLPPPSLPNIFWVVVWSPKHVLRRLFWDSSQASSQCIWSILED